MRRFFAALVLASTVSLTAVIPSASAQGVGFFQPPFNTGLAGCTGLNGANQSLFPTLPTPVIGVTQCPPTFGLGSLGFGGGGQLSAQAFPTNGGVGVTGQGLNGIGFGLPGGLINPPGFGPGNPIGIGGIGGVTPFGITGQGIGGTGQLSAQAVPTGQGLNNLGGIGFGGIGGLTNPPGFGPGNPIGIGGVTPFGVTGQGLGGGGQLSAQAFPTNGGVNGLGTGFGLGGCGFGFPGGLINPPGFGFGNPIGTGGLGIC